jgi:hypothetical protein
VFQEFSNVPVDRSQRDARLKPPNARPRFLDAQRLIGCGEHLTQGATLFGVAR